MTLFSSWKRRATMYLLSFLLSHFLTHEGCPQSMLQLSGPGTHQNLMSPKRYIPWISGPTGTTKIGPPLENFRKLYILLLFSPLLFPYFSLSFLFSLSAHQLQVTQPCLGTELFLLNNCQMHGELPGKLSIDQI